MSSSSETSLAELPQPYDISTAVSKALCIDHPSASSGILTKPEIGVCSGSSNNNANNNCRSRRGSATGLFPASAGYLSNYEMQVQGGVGIPHHGCSYSVGDGSDSYSAAASPYYCPGPSTPYPPYFHHLPETTQYLYPLHHPHHPSQAQQHPHQQQTQQQPQHYHPTPILHHQLPDPPHTSHMEMESWSETAAMSLCTSTSSMFESPESIEQLDKFCKYIDSSGDEEFMTDKDGESSVEGCSRDGCSGAGCSGAGCSGGAGGSEGGEGDHTLLNSAKNRYKCFITGNPCSEMLDSPPKKRRRAVCGVAEYYNESLDNTVAGNSAALMKRKYNSVTMEERNWIVEMDNANMWRQFDMVGTEMVITKAGRYTHY